MSKRESLSRYSLILQKLRKQPSSFAEISDMLARESELQGYNFNISIRTFQRDIEDIGTLYNIDIQYNFSRKVYFIDMEQQPEVNERILEAFDTFNALNIAYRLSNHIHFEKRRPQGTDNLYGLLHSIKNMVRIRFNYQKYWDDIITLRNLEPYALKEFKNRWYLLANDLKDKRVKTFALDRLSNLEITNQGFQFPNNFNVTDYFKNCFGIISPNADKPEEVILSFDPFQGKYIKSLPLHESQEVLEDTEDELLIKLTLFITHDFLMELLSLGDNVKVMQPESLIADVKRSLQNTLKLY
jgi:predicted DNA-binding transcriptional regulator YafY